VAEFYDTDPITTSGISVASLGSGTPKLVYTSPAGKTTISAFTTMVKNKVDLDPTITVEAASDEVKFASGIADPFDRESYTGNAEATHDVVTDLVKGVLDYITGTLNKTVNESPAVVAGLYDVIFKLVAGVAADPTTAATNTNTLVSSANSDISQAIDDAEEALEEAGNATLWDPNDSLTLYEIAYDNGEYNMRTYRTGPQWTEYEGKPFSELGDNDLSPSSGESEQFTLAEMWIDVKSAVKASPGKIVTTVRYRSMKIPLSKNAEVYTMDNTQDYAKRADSFESLRVDDNHHHGTWHGSNEANGLNTGTITMIRGSNNATVGTITMNKTDRTFVWVQEDDPAVFSEDFGFTTQGNYFHENEGTNAETYLFAADNGAVAKVVRPNSDPSRLVMVIYPVRQSRVVFFNAAAADEIRDWLKAHPVTPLW
jgi:hypothetical protein